MKSSVAFTQTPAFGQINLPLFFTDPYTHRLELRGTNLEQDVTNSQLPDIGLCVHWAITARAIRRHGAQADIDRGERGLERYAYPASPSATY